MSRIVKKCPFCDSGLIHKRCRDASRPKYRCSHCKTNFSKPLEHEVNRKNEKPFIPGPLQKFFPEK